jgi:phospholipid/cholesterol/gamma-HCH transport system substrate-binding protein
MSPKTPRAKRRDEFIVGIFTTVAAIITIFASIWLVRGGLAAGYPLYARFAWGSGIKQGAPVWLVGVTVGYVDKVDLDPRGTLLITLRIEDQYRVPLGSVAQIVPNGFFGDQAVALTLERPNEQSHAEGDTLPSVTGPSGIAALTSRADTLSRSLSAILDGLRAEMIDSGGVAEMRHAMGSANRMFAQFTAVAQEQSRQLALTMATLRSRVAAIDSAQLDSTVRSFNATSASLALFTSELGTAATQLTSLLAKADSGQGSMARMLNDPGLYDDMRRLVTRMDSLMIDFKANPRRYLKFSVF